MISVVVPVYNVEKYLDACVASIRAQDITAMEIILVDDGSTDSSGAICDRLAGECPGIRVIHQPNSGPGVARNAGIEAAQGEFITFVDSDDLLAPDFLTDAIRLQQVTDADIVCFGYRLFDDSKLPAFLSEATPDGTLPSQSGTHAATDYRMFTGRQALREILYQRRNYNSMCAKLFRISLFDNIRFTPGIYYEDLDMVYRVMLQAQKVVISPASLYCYRRNYSSILGRISPHRADVLDVCDRMVEYMRQNAPALVNAARSRRLSAYFDILCLLYSLDKHPSSAPSGWTAEETRQIKARCRQVIKQERLHGLFDINVRIKNKLGILLSYLGQDALQALAAVLYKQQKR